MQSNAKTDLKSPAARTADHRQRDAAKRSDPRPRRRGRIAVDTTTTIVPAANAAAKSSTDQSATKSPGSKHPKPARGSGPKAKRSRPSALDAAAQVLAGLNAKAATEGITAAELITRMAKQNLWTSPGGKTPQATLYAAMVREITAKGSASRFRRVSPGHFTAMKPRTDSSRKASA